MPQPRCWSARMTMDGGVTTYWNTEQTAYCDVGFPGDPVTVAAHTYSSLVSQAAADAAALAAAEAALECGIQGQLSGLLWRMPCTSVVTPGTPTCTCTDPGPVTVTLVGSVGVTYNVTMRIRGVVETKDYIGGRQLVHPSRIFRYLRCRRFNLSRSASRQSERLRAVDQ